MDFASLLKKLFSIHSGAIIFRLKANTFRLAEFLHIVKHPLILNCGGRKNEQKLISVLKKLFKGL